MANLNQTLSSKYLLLTAAISYLLAFLLGGIVADALKTLGFIVLVIGIIALNQELKKKKNKELGKKESIQGLDAPESKSVKVIKYTLLAGIAIVIAYFFVMIIFLRSK